MTETVFADMMAKPDSGFDAMAPENISPLVVWLGSAESSDVTGRVFEVEGGIIRAAEGWQHGVEVDKGARWEPGELGPVVRSLLAQGCPPLAGVRGLVESTMPPRDSAEEERDDRNPAQRGSQMTTGITRSVQDW